MDLLQLRRCVRNEKFEISLHALKEAHEEEIDLEDIGNAILRGEIIEDYPGDPRGASCLVLGFSRKRPIHVVCAMLPTGWARIITVYIPRLPKWLNPRERRK